MLKVATTRVAYIRSVKGCELHHVRLREKLRDISALTHTMDPHAVNAGMWHALAISQWNLANEEDSAGRVSAAKRLLRNAGVALKRCLALNSKMSAAHRDMPSIKHLMHTWGMHDDIELLNLDSYVSGTEREGLSSGALPAAESLQATLDGDEELQDLQELMAEENAPMLPELDALSSGILQQAELFLEAGYVQHAVHALCSDEGWVVHVPPEERTIEHGTLPPHLASRAQRLLQICGFVLIRHAMPQDVLDRLGAQATHESDAMLQVSASGSTDSQTLDKRVPLHMLADDAVALNPWFMPAVSGGMRSSRLELGSAALLPAQHAAPHSSGKHLPRDEHAIAGFLDGYAGGVLDTRLQAAYGTAADEATCHEHARAATHPKYGHWNAISPSPALGVHIVLPLGDTGGRRRGVLHATAGSHMQCTPDTCAGDDEDKCPHEGPSMEEVRMGPGDALLVDSRVHLSGLLSPWPTLVLTMNQEWFRSPKQRSDQKNTASFDALSPELQSLFKRVDALKATQTARSDLQDMFVDVDEMESRYEFDAYDYDESSFFADMDLSADQYRRKMDPVIQGYRVSSKLVEQTAASAAALPHKQRPELA